MQTFLLNIDDNYVKSFLEYVNNIPKNHVSFKKFTEDYELDDISDDLALKIARDEYIADDVISWEDYLQKREI